MEVECKFDVGQEVYFMYDNRVAKDKIREIKITLTAIPDSSVVKKDIWYYLWVKGPFLGTHLFRSKEELLKSL